MQRLERNLDKYKPDMVIVMMGVNDPKFYIKPVDKAGAITLFFRDLRVYRLVKAIPDTWNENLAHKKQIESEQKYKEEERKLKNMVKNYPKDIVALVDLAEFYEEHEKYMELVEVGKKLIELAPNEPLSYISLGLAYSKLKMYGEAEKVLKKALEIDPNNYKVYLLLGDIYQIWNKPGNRPEEAIEMYEKFLSIVGKYYEEAYIRLAKLHKNLNNSKLSYQLFKEVIERNPEKTEEIFLIGELYKELNKTDEALNLFRTTINKNPDNYAAYAELAWYYLKNNNTEEAEKVLGSIKSRNISVFVYGNLGTHYEKENDFEKANEMFRKGFSFDKRYYRPTPRENYQKLYKTMNERGIKLAVMQYPTLSVDNLKKMFRGDEAVIFVSNEDNFKKFLTNANYEDYFVDSFGGSWGHATLKGNRLIAENVANVVLNENLN